MRVIRDKKMATNFIEQQPQPKKLTTENTEYTEKNLNCFLRVLRALRGEKILAAFARICGLVVRISRIYYEYTQ